MTMKRSYIYLAMLVIILLLLAILAWCQYKPNVSFQDDPSRSADQFAYNYDYLLPRAYPTMDPEVMEARRATGRAQLASMRAALGIKWVGEYGIMAAAGGPSPCGWTYAGPTNVPGRITDIAIDQLDPQRIFTTTVGGIYYSVTAGRRWRRISDELFAGKAASVAIVGPGQALVGLGDPSYHFTPSCTGRAGTGCVGGIYLFNSLNPQNPTFAHIDVTTTPDQLDNAIIYRLIPATLTYPTTVYAATSKGVYRGQLVGSTWTFEPYGLSGHWITDLEIDRSGSKPILYAGQRLPAAIWRCNENSFDCTQTTSWDKVEGDLPMDSRWKYVRLALAPSAPETMYAHFWGRENDLLYGGIYKTTNLKTSGTVNWTLQQDGSDPPFYTLGDRYTRVLEVDPLDPNHVFFGGAWLYESTDSGVHWKKPWETLPSPTPSEYNAYARSIAKGSDTTYPLEIHADQMVLKFHPADPHTVIIGTDGGIYKSTPMNASTWHWLSLSHGMRNTEFHTVSGQNATATLVSGGLQDNGSWFTFGNRAWYRTAWADGMYTHVDAGNADIIYSSWQGLTVEERLWPVPTSPPPGYITFICLNTKDSDEDCLGTKSSSGDFLWNTTGNRVPTRPIITDPTEQGVALAIGRVTIPNPADSNKRILDKSKPPPPQALLKTTDSGVHWQEIWTLQQDQFIGLANYWGDHRIAISHNKNTNTGKKTYFVALQALQTLPSGAIWTNSIWLNTDAGEPGSWQETAGFPPDEEVRGISAIDANYAIAMASKYSDNAAARVYRWDGTNWTQLQPSSTATSLPGVPTTAAIIDPNNTNTVYAGTMVGVYKGTINGTTLDWAPLDFGLPNGVDVHDLWLNTATRQLMVATYGYGVYEYNIDNPGNCPRQEQLLVRDHVFDSGSIPSPFDIPDPEHPTIGDSVGPITFFKPNDTPGNKLYWWESTDIRIDIPSIREPANKLDPPVDNFEFEACPVGAQTCKPGMMVDSQPVPGSDANLYVQVQQRGLGEVNNLRVITLFTDATTGVPPLPDNFWSTVFPPRDASGNGACGTFNPATSNGWQLVGCKTAFGPVTPAVPEVAWFPWHIPETAAEHSCMLTIIDSPQDEIPTNIRQMNRVENMVPNSPLIAQRNLHIISPPANNPPAPGTGGTSAPYTGLTSIWVPNYSDQATQKDTLLAFNPIELGRLSFILPAGTHIPNMPDRCGQKTEGPGISRITLPRGLTEGKVTLGASERLVVSFGAKVLEHSGGYGIVANAGRKETRIGPWAQVGALISEAETHIKWFATIHGPVTTSAKVFKRWGSTVQGEETTDAVLTPNMQTSWTVPPFNGQADINIEAKQRLSLPPGSFRRVTVGPGATLQLTAGVYRIQTLDPIERGGNIELETSKGEIIVYLRSSLKAHGPVLDLAGGGSGGLFVVLGDTVKVGGPFQASIVAPYANEVRLGKGCSGSLAGTFFGKNLRVNPRTKIVHRAFSGWKALGSCAPLSTEEEKKAISLGLDPSVLYPVATGAQHIQLPVGAQSKVRLGLRYETDADQVNATKRFRVLSVKNGKVHGGATFLVRH